MKQAQFDFDPTSRKRAHVEITSAALRHLQEHALGEFPREAVGCLLGSWDSCTLRILRACSVANNHPSPETNFEVSPETVLWAESEAEASGCLLVGWYHSHPNGNPEPSIEDQRTALPFWVQGIVSFQQGGVKVRFYAFGEQEGSFEELEWTTC